MEGALAGTAAHQRMAQLVLPVGAHRVSLEVGIEVQPLEPHRRPRVESRLDVLGPEQELIRRCDHPPRLGRGLEVCERVVPVLDQPLETPRAVDRHQGVLGQEVEKGLVGGKQAGCEALHTRRQVTAQQGVHELIDHARLHALGRGELPEAVGALDEETAVEQQLTSGRGHRIVEPALGALARRVELADRLHLVPEELHAQGQGALRGKEVEDVAAHGELPRLLDERHARIAGGQQCLHQCVTVDPLAHLQVDRAGAHHLP